MKSKLWVFRNINLSQRASLAQALSISPATASLFLARGVTTPDEAMSWMSLQAPHDPFLIPDMEQAVERLHRAVTTQEPICFYGDYDVDGITATSVYLSFFGELGAKVSLIYQCADSFIFVFCNRKQASLITQNRFAL